MKSSKKLIFVISYCYPNESNRQNGIFVYEQCRLLQASGVNVVSLYVNNDKRFKSKITQYSFGDVSLLTNSISLRCHTYMPMTVTVAYYLFYDKLFRSAIDSFGLPDLIYAHFSFPTGFVAEELSRKYGVPYAVMEHSSMYLNDGVPYFIKKNLPGLIAGAKSYLCVSNSLKNSLTNIVPEQSNKIKVVYNAIDSAYEYAVRRDKQSFTFFAAGNLVAIKQFNILLDAISLMKDETQRFVLRIGGDGQERENLLRQVDQLGLTSIVSLLGRLSKEEMQREYMECDAFVLPSRKETFGIVCREAMFVGRPIVSFDNGGIREGWDDSFGIIVKEQTADALADALRKVIKEYDSFDLRQISQKSRKTFSPETISNKLIQELF